MIEAMKLAYADRATFLGDPASVDAPLARLLSKNYAAKLRSRIHAAQARPARDIYAGGARWRGGAYGAVLRRRPGRQRGLADHDAEFQLGLGLVADGTGILLDDEPTISPPSPARPTRSDWWAARRTRRDPASARCHP